MRVHIPTINDQKFDYDKLFQMWKHTANSSDQVIELDFGNCCFLRPNAVAFLGGLARFLMSQNRNVIFKWATLRQDVHQALLENDFSRVFGGLCSDYDGVSIPYKEYIKKDKDEICQQLIEKWIGRGFVNVSPILQGQIIGNVWEIFENAFEHSCSNIGVFSCGQYFPKNKELQLTVIDFGIGIPNSVRHFKRKDVYLPQTCMQWAFTEGRSTKEGSDDIAKGIGLDILKSFIKINHGCLEIFSHEGHALIDSEQEKYEQIDTFFEGTLVNIKLKVDDKYYQLEGEEFCDIEF